MRRLKNDVWLNFSKGHSWRIRIKSQIRLTPRPAGPSQCKDSTCVVQYRPDPATCLLLLLLLLLSVGTPLMHNKVSLLLAAWTSLALPPTTPEPLQKGNFHGEKIHQQALYLLLFLLIQNPRCFMGKYIQRIKLSHSLPYRASIHLHSELNPIKKSPWHLKTLSCVVKGSQTLGFLAVKSKSKISLTSLYFHWLSVESLIFTWNLDAILFHVTSDDKTSQGSLGGSRVNCKDQCLLPRQSENITWMLKIHILEQDRGSVFLYLVYGDQIQSIDPQPKHQNTWTQGIWVMGNNEVFFQIIHIKKIPGQL